MFAGSLGVVLFVEDLPRSVEYYRRVLGFGFIGYWDPRHSCLVRTPREAPDSNLAKLYVGEISIDLHLASSPQYGAGFEVEVTDFDVYLQQVREHGGEPSDPEEDLQEFRRFTVADPFGYVWTFRGEPTVTIRAEERHEAFNGEITEFDTLEDYGKAAAAAGISLPDYFDRLWGSRRQAQRVFEHLAEFGVFEPPPLHVLEIGTGTGVFAEGFLRLQQPTTYESYEPADDWAAWLAEQHGLQSRPADGISLRHTADACVDFLHAHNVFVSLGFLTTCQYFQEIIRVVKPGGCVAFDILSEACLDDPTVAAWLATEMRWPCFLSTEYVRGFFTRHGFDFLGEFLMGSFDVEEKCFSQYLVFRKRKQ